MAHASTQAQWTTSGALARWFGVSTQAVRQWIASGRLRAVQVQQAHYADDRARKTRRGNYRIYEPDLIAFLERVRSGTKPPASLWRR